MLTVRLTFMLLVLLSIPAAGFADAITTREGITHTGTIARITGEHIALTKARQSAVFIRSAVMDVTFDVSDVVALGSGDTLQAKVLRTEDSILVVALEQGLRILPVSSIAGIAYSSGGPLRVREISDTDDSFHSGEVTATIGRTALSLSMSIGAQSAVYRFGGSVPNWLTGFRESPIEKQFAGALYDLGARFDIEARFSVALGILLYTGEANGPGAPELREVGYFGFYTSGMYCLFPYNAFDVYVRLQLGILRGWWKLSGNVNKDARSPVASVVPAVGIQYRFFELLQVYCECDGHFATLPLSESGESLETHGLVFSLGLRMHVPKIGL